MYHGVRSGNHRINGRHITAEHFEKQLQYFKKRFTIVPLRQLCEMKVQGIIPRERTIALTFDDGFLNNLTTALPLLEKYKIHATFFICTAGISDQTYSHPTDRVDLIRISGEPKSIQINGENFFRKGHQVVSGKDGEHAYQYINKLSFEQWLKANRDLKDQLDVKTTQQYNELYQLLDEPSVRDLLKSELVTAGSHSHHHINLSTLAPGEVQYQLQESKTVLNSYSQSADTVAFPYGFYNNHTIAIAKDVGYRYLIGGGHVHPPYNKDVFPRIGVLDGAGFSYTMLMISNGFKRFGF